MDQERNILIRGHFSVHLKSCELIDTSPMRYSARNVEPLDIAAPK